MLDQNPRQIYGFKVGDYIYDVTGPNEIGALVNLLKYKDIDIDGVNHIELLGVKKNTDNYVYYYDKVDDDRRIRPLK